MNLKISDALSNVKRLNPIVHNITNYVTAHDVANIIIATGGSPIMTDEPEDVYDITTISNALNINIGTLNASSIKAMLIAGKRADELSHPILLDPVGAGASRLRTETAKRLLSEMKIAVVRGNISEIMALYSGCGHTKGVDANLKDAVTRQNLPSKIAFAKDFAKAFNTNVAISGPIDIVTDGATAFAVSNGVEMMGKITGSGCQLSGLMTAFLAANPLSPLEAALASTVMMGVAGEKAFATLEKDEGNATFSNRIIDAVFNISPETLLRDAKYETFK